MSILVVCPGCRKRFEVSEKFAGQTGPCPACKAPIRVPTKEEEVKVHAPTEFGTSARDAYGKQISAKPIARRDTKWNSVAAAGVAAAVLAVFAVAWIGARQGLFEGSLAARAIGLLLVSPPIVVAGYFFLRDSENLFPYRGKALYLRAAICSVVYVALWALWGYLANNWLTGELWTWIFVAPFFVAGGFTALMCLDLDFSSGFFHYSFYVLVTVVLRWAAGMGWVWEISNPLTG